MQELEQKLPMPEHVANLPLGLTRCKVGGKRYYYRQLDNGEWRYYNAATSISGYGPTAQPLIDWIARHGREGADRLKNQAAEYGTIMHAAFDDILKHGEVQIDKCKKRCYEVCSHEGWPTSLAQTWATRLPKDIHGFIAFIKEREIEPLYMEQYFCNDAYRMAGTADLVCLIKWKNKKRLAIIDYKSGGIWESHRVQLWAYKKMAQQSGLNIELLLNYAPKDYRSTPTYELVNQTEKIDDWWFGVLAIRGKRDLAEKLEKGKLKTPHYTNTITLNDEYQEPTKLMPHELESKIEETEEDEAYKAVYGDTWKGESGDLERQQAASN